VIEVQLSREEKSEMQTKEFIMGPRTQLEWGFGGRRKSRDGALLLALFIGGIGAGQFVASTWLIDYPLSALFGLVLVAVGKTTAHLIYLGRPSRFYRLFLRPHSSWISRGLIFMVIFVVVGLGYLAPAFGFTWLPWTTGDPFGQMLWAIATIAAFIVMIYDGFVLASCKSISSWHTMLLPVMFFTYALAGGVAMTSLTAIAARTTSLSVDTMVTLDTFLLAAMLTLVIFYVLHLASSDTTAKESLRRLLMSKMAVIFIGLAIVAGLLIPLILTFVHQAAAQETMASAMLVASAMLELAGDLSVRHSILRAGLHIPIYQIK